MAKRAVDYQQQTEEILAKLDIQAEYRAMGVEFVGNPRSNGCFECWAVDRPHGNHPSAFVNLETGRYIDKGQSGDNLSLFDFAVKYGNLGLADFKEARKFFAELAGVKLARTKPPENPADLIEFLPWEGRETQLRNWCLFHKKGITPEAVKLAGGRVGRYPCRNSKGEKIAPKYVVLAFPAYGEKGINADPVAWVLYNITGGQLEIYRGKDQPPDLVKMKSIGATRGTMMNPHALQRLAEESPEIECIVKTGGPSDMLAALSALPPDLREKVLVLTNASSETGDVLPHQVAMFAGRRGVVVHDADRAGEVGAIKWLAALHPVTEDVRQVRLPWAITDKNGRDLRDFFRGMPEDGRAEPGEPRDWAAFWSLVEASPPYTPINGHASPQAPAPPASGEAATNSHDPAAARDFFAANPATAREKMIVDAVQLDVLGCTKKGGVKVFSKHHRRSVVIDRVSRMYYEDLLQIAGEPAKERIALSKEEAENSTDTFLLSEVKSAIAMLSGYRTLSEETELGMGCWQGATMTGEEYPSVVLVGKGEAAEWNGDQVLRRIDHPRCRGHVLDFESAGTDWYAHAELAALCEQCKSPEFRRQVLAEVVALFEKWRWKNKSAPMTVSALTFATWIQTFWAWRPQVSIIGASNSGKSTLVHCLADIFGKLAKTSSDSSAAGMRQILQSSARIIIHDEFDISSTDKSKQAEHGKILKMLRAASRGDTIVRGTSDQKGQEFVLRHIVWLAGIHQASNQEADRNRSICLELLGKLPNSPKLVLPTAPELAALGQRMLAVAITCANEAKRLAAKIAAHRIDGVHDRIVESYAVPAAMIAAIMGEGEDAAVVHLKEMLADLTQTEREVVPDVNELIGEILAANIQIGSERISVSQLLDRILDKDREEDHKALEARGIKVGQYSANKDIPARLHGQWCLSIAHKIVASQLLRNTRWEQNSFDQILRRYPDAFDDQKKIGHKTRCISLPLTQIMEEFLNRPVSAAEMQMPAELF